MVHGQRLKEGCFDAEPITCDSAYDPDDIDFNVEDVCRRIVWDLLPPDDNFILFQLEDHKDYLNSIEASEEFCSQIRKAYSQCIFCTEDKAFFDLARNVAQVVACAGRPTQEQVLLDNDYYPKFQTAADIEATCQELEVAYQRPLLPLSGVAMPSTIDLNIRQIQIKHLCLGYCEGGCFDKELYPPSCDPDAFQGVRDENLDVFAVCNDLTYFGFYYDTRTEILMNTSQHVEYLQIFSGNTTFCQQARQAYSSCLWCAESLCFAEPNRPTCDPPSKALSTATTTAELGASVDANAVCASIYQFFADMTFPDDLYNYSKHATSFLLGDNHPFCDQARQVYHQCYWCAQNVPMDFCASSSHCEPNLSIPEGFESTTLAALGLAENHTQSTPSELDCDAVFQEWTATRQEPYTIHGCYEDIVLADLCETQFCELEEAEKFNTTDYLGANTKAKKRALVWLSRVASLMSLGGACYILQDILKDKKIRKLTYHQLLLAMASFDVITALAWVFSTAPIPSDEGWYVEGAIGNDITCGIQSFFVQLGFTSVFYNVSLAAYYVLVVVYSWKEFQLVEMKKHFHILPLLLGFGLAFSAIPTFGWSEYGCHMTPGSDLWAIFVFVVFPISSSIIGISTCLLMVYCKVRGQAAASRKWSFGIGKASQLEQAVFWQCVSYGLAFYISWPILFAVYLGNVDQDGPYGLAVIVAFVAPLQGFNNFCVYIRPKLKGRGKKKKNSKGSGPSSSSGLSRSSTATMGNSSNPFSRLMRMMTNRHSMSSGLYSNSERSIPILDPSAAIAQRPSLFSRPSGKMSRWSLFSKQTSGKHSAASLNSKAAGKPSGKPSANAMAQWGLQEPAAAAGPSAAAMSQWGLSPAPAPAPSAVAMSQWGLQTPAPAPAPSAAAMSQWGLQEPTNPAKPSNAVMAQWGLREVPQQPSASTVVRWQLGDSVIGAEKMQDVDESSTHDDQVECTVPKDPAKSLDASANDAKEPQTESVDTTHNDGAAGTEEEMVQYVGVASEEKHDSEDQHRSTEQLEPAAQGALESEGMADDSKKGDSLICSKEEVSGAQECAPKEDAKVTKKETSENDGAGDLHVESNEEGDVANPNQQIVVGQEITLPIEGASKETLASGGPENGGDENSKGDYGVDPHKQAFNGQEQEAQGGASPPLECEGAVAPENDCNEKGNAETLRHTISEGKEDATQQLAPDMGQGPLDNDGGSEGGSVIDPGHAVLEGQLSAKKLGAEEEAKDFLGCEAARLTAENGFSPQKQEREDQLKAEIAEIQQEIVKAKSRMSLSIPKEEESRTPQEADLVPES